MKDKERPQWHFSPQVGMLNDPNGLYYEEATGLYHVYYQYQYATMGDCKLFWGHAFGKSLLSLTEAEPVMSYDENGATFSGSACIDYENNSGLFSEGSNPSRRAFFAYTVCDLETRREYQQCAYSCDGWQLIRDKILIPNKDDQYGLNFFRDPSLFRFDGKWFLMTGGGYVRLFVSEDLLHWRYQSTVKNVPVEEDKIVEDMEAIQKYLPLNDPMHENVIAECPDVCRLKDGERERFVLSGGGVFYLVGDIELKNGVYEFVPEGKRKKAVYSADFFSGKGEMYAMQTVYGEKDRVQALFWLRDIPKEENKPYNGCLSLPYEMSLKNGRVRYRFSREVYELFQKTNLSDQKEGRKIETPTYFKTEGKGRFAIKETGIELHVLEDGLKIFLEGKVGYSENMWIPTYGEAPYLELIVDKYVVEGVFCGNVFSFFLPLEVKEVEIELQNF